MTKIFAGIIVSQVDCFICKNSSYTFENILDISLSFKKENRELNEIADLQDFLNYFVREETLNEFFCNKCKIITKNSKKLSFLKAPDILVIHLKRFEYDKSTGKKEKIEDKIKFPIKDLDMTSHFHEIMKGNILPFRPRLLIILQEKHIYIIYIP